MYRDQKQILADLNKDTNSKDMVESGQRKRRVNRMKGQSAKIPSRRCSRRTALPPTAQLRYPHKDKLLKMRSVLSDKIH